MKLSLDCSIQRNQAIGEQEMTAEQLIKRHLIQIAAQEGEITGWHKRLTAETIDEAWQKLMIESGLNHD
jgi:hypothetical protein